MDLSNTLINMQSYREMYKSEDGGMKIIPFKGDETKWWMWKEKQRAKIKLYDLIDILDGTTPIPVDSTNLTDDKKHKEEK